MLIMTDPLALALEYSNHQKSGYMTIVYICKLRGEKNQNDFIPHEVREIASCDIPHGNRDQSPCPASIKSQQ
jgi:hypothetical protein